MKVFLSWSGSLSHEIALVLKSWLPAMLQSIEPFVSSVDIDKGSRWFSEIGNQLDQCDFGILCVTRSNATSPWILFEAGALSKKVGQACVCPLLIDMTPADLEGPMVNFNAATLDNAEILKLVKSVNSANGTERLSDAILEKTFSLAATQFQEEVAQARTNAMAKKQEKEDHRTTREVLDELLQLCRTTARNLPSRYRKAGDYALYDREIVEAANREARKAERSA